jgi:hypothetical protein
VFGVVTAPFAVFFKFQLALKGLFVFAGIVIYPLTDGAS